MSRGNANRSDVPATGEAKHHADWWRFGVFYQIYPRSFADSNGDGIGDFAGIRHRLAYLQSLSVDAVWVNPWFASPFRDGGYDVADYRRVHPSFGTMEELEQLIAEARAAGIGFLFDFVPNHTSHEHRWFKDALVAAPGSRERARYHFASGRGADAAEPPNDWISEFGGPAWTRLDDGDWYLHTFDAAQPDLNWSNPEVQAEFDDVIRFWVGKGVVGFRADAVQNLAKRQQDGRRAVQMESAAAERADPEHAYRDWDEVHRYIRRWREVADSFEAASLVTVAEAVVESWDRLALYIRPDEFHQVFNPFYMKAPWDADRLRTAISDAITGAATVGAQPTWALSSHDVVRPVTRFGLPSDVDAADWLLDGERALLDEDRGLRRARAAALLTLALPGSVYIYQGEELGLPEVHDLPIEALHDPIWEQSRHSLKGRDGCRVPLPWDRQPPTYGFGGDGAWLPMPAHWGSRSVVTQSAETSSTLTMYRRALQTRSSLLRHGDFEWADAGAECLMFRRRAMTCIANLGSDPVRIPDGEVIVASEDLEWPVLPPDCAAWILDSRDP